MIDEDNTIADVVGRPDRAALAITSIPALAADKPIIFIMGDDIGWYNIGAYHQGMMAGRTPNLDKLAAEGMRFTDLQGPPRWVRPDGRAHRQGAVEAA
jgi:hypothetical protein